MRRYGPETGFELTPSPTETPPSTPTSPPTSPSRRRILFGVVGSALVLVLAGITAYFVLFKDDSPPKFSLGKSTRTTVASSGAPAGTLAGGWTTTSGGRAGYRVREKLGLLPAPSDAVGRTSDVTGAFTITDEAGALAAKDISMKVDMTTLKSDDDRRDGRLHEQGIESARFPTATFKAVGPFAVPNRARAGTAFNVPVTGTLTLHGVTRTVTVTIQGRVTGASVELVGSYTFPLSDFKIDKPSSSFVVSIEDNGTLEFKLEFHRQ